MIDRIGRIVSWIEICAANRLTAAGRSWADAALRRYGHFSGRIKDRRRSEWRR